MVTPRLRSMLLASLGEGMGYAIQNGHDDSFDDHVDDTGSKGSDNGDDETNVHFRCRTSWGGGVDNLPMGDSVAWSLLLLVSLVYDY